jgi:hypothetical protein
LEGDEFIIKFIQSLCPIWNFHHFN